MLQPVNSMPHLQGLHHLPQTGTDHAFNDSVQPVGLLWTYWFLQSQLRLLKSPWPSVVTVVNHRHYPAQYLGPDSWPLPFNQLRSSMKDLRNDGGRHPQKSLSPNKSLTDIKSLFTYLVILKQLMSYGKKNIYSSIPHDVNLYRFKLMAEICNLCK